MADGNFCPPRNVNVEKSPTEGDKTECVQGMSVTNLEVIGTTQIRAGAEAGR